MIELDGIEYNVKTPQENAVDLVNTINEYASTNGVTNSEGEIINIDSNPTNPLYLICYGLSYLITVLQKLLYSAACSLNISRSSSRQLLNLAEVAGVKRKPATKTIISALAYAENNNPCTITTTLSSTVTYGNDTLVFHPTFQVTIPAGGVARIILECETYGSYTLAENTITAFDAPVSGLRRLISQASTPGQDVEPISSLRSRLYNRGEEYTRCDKAMAAISALPGVSLCNIYFNYSTDSDVIINGITVHPRRALLLVQGYSPQIAKTFYSHLICDTTQGPAGRNIDQTYTTQGHQDLTVHIVTPDSQPLYVAIYTGITLDVGQIADLQDLVCTLANSLTIGQSVSSVDIINIIQDYVEGYQIKGVSLSLDDVDYTYKQTPPQDTLFSLIPGNIHVLES